MSLKSRVNPCAPSWRGRLWQHFVLLGEAIELSDAERLERRVAALEASAAKMPEHTEQL